ncbi:MAG: outer membrane immunogenic protein [Paracoccaceae bacterium]|jgi:outer membrane immunogenic protein
MIRTSVVAVLSVMAGPVLAGGLDPVAVQPQVVAQSAPVYSGNDWTGFYAGGQLGYGWAETGGATSIEGEGGFFGLHAGYNWDFGNTVIGAEIDYDESAIELDAAGSQIDNVLRLKLRGGYDFGSILAYGVIGVAQADATVRAVEYSDIGYLIGAGVGYDLGNNWVVGSEVLFHQFDNFDNTGIDVDVTTVSARVSYNF